MEVLGRNSITNLNKMIKGKVLLFTQEGIYDLFKEVIDAELVGTTVTKFNKITENPKREEIQIAQDELLAQTFDYIVAFGGGSVIDFAKAFRFYDNRKIPLIVIPTTAGTGSQATQFAVVYIDGVKNSLDCRDLLPDIAIADSQFVEKAPKYLKACAAMDAYCQAIESFWAVKATEESKQYALEAISTCRDFLVEAVNTCNKNANEEMVRAAHLAGKAINISRTTAAHALSYKITSEYGIPHGHAVALSIAGLFKLNSTYFNEENRLLEAMGVTQNQVVSHFYHLMKCVGLEYDFAKLEIRDFDKIISSVNIDRLNNNPRTLNKTDLMQVLQIQR